MESFASIDDLIAAVSDPASRPGPTAVNSINIFTSRLAIRWSDGSCSGSSSLLPDGLMAFGTTCSKHGGCIFIRISEFSPDIQRAGDRLACLAALGEIAVQALEPMQMAFAFIEAVPVLTLDEFVHNVVAKISIVKIDYNFRFQQNENIFHIQIFTCMMITTDDAQLASDWMFLRVRAPAGRRDGRPHEAL